MKRIAVFTGGKAIRNSYYIPDPRLEILTNEIRHVDRLIVCGNAAGGKALAKMWKEWRETSVITSKLPNKQQAFYDGIRRTINWANKVIVFYDDHDLSVKYAINYALKKRKPILIER